MQRHFIKYIFLFIGFYSQMPDTHGQELFTQKADSLFNEKKYSEAAILYEDLLKKHSIHRSHAFLKLAYINEIGGNFSRSVYYLSEYFQLNPSDLVFEKINKIAEENSFSGYSRSDLNFILLLYERYFIYVTIALFLFLAYSFYVLIMKKLKGESTSLGNKLSFLFLVFAVLSFINLGLFYKQGIVNKENIIVRSAPSAGAEVIGHLKEGSRVNIIGEKDIWLRLILNGKIQFAKKSDFWIIEKD
jgi:hypothetical protein